MLNAYEAAPQNYGPQTLYFLACLAGGADMPEAALAWLRKAIREKEWWYRSEVLEDDDLEALKHDAEFISLKAASDARYQEAVSTARPLFSWKAKQADRLLLAVHGNTQNAETARLDWSPVISGGDIWQLETIQSGEPDGYGTYRWSYDMTSYLPVADAMQRVRHVGYRTLACGGFSAGCDMLLRAVTFTQARCDLLVLQSPWIPLLEEHAGALVHAICRKNIALRIFCGAEDEDCLPLAGQLYELAKQEGAEASLRIQENTRHQFPTEPYSWESF